MTGHSEASVLAVIQYQ